MVDFDVEVDDNVGTDGVKDPSRCWVLQLNKPRLNVAMLYRLVLMGNADFHQLSLRTLQIATSQHNCTSIS